MFVVGPASRKKMRKMTNFSLERMPPLVVESALMCKTSFCRVLAKANGMASYILAKSAHMILSAELELAGSVFYCHRVKEVVVQ